MFDAEKLLGALLGSGLDRHGQGSALDSLGGLGQLGGLASPGKQTLAMGLLGVAVAAFEHFTENRSQAPSSGAAPGSAPGIPPQPPAAPPPPPGAAISAGPPPSAPPAAPPAAPAAASEPGQDEALLYLRGMIAAAAADGRIDAQERGKIIGQLDRSGLDSEEHDFLVREMRQPADIDALVQAVQTPQQALNLYVCSLLAIEVDTEAERDYLRRLAQGLRLSPERLSAVHTRYQVSL